MCFCIRDQGILCVFRTVIHHRFQQHLQHLSDRTAADTAGSNIASGYGKRGELCDIPRFYDRTAEYCSTAAGFFVFGKQCCMETKPVFELFLGCL